MRAIERPVSQSYCDVLLLLQPSRTDTHSVYARTLQARTAVQRGGGNLRYVGISAQHNTAPNYCSQAVQGAA